MNFCHSAYLARSATRSSNGSALSTLCKVYVSKRGLRLVSWMHERFIVLSSSEMAISGGCSKNWDGSLVQSILE